MDYVDRANILLCND